MLVMFTTPAGTSVFLNTIHIVYMIQEHPDYSGKEKDTDTYTTAIHMMDGSAHSVRDGVFTNLSKIGKMKSDIGYSIEE